MLHRNRKGLVIAIIALLVLGALTMFLSQAAHDPVSAPVETTVTPTNDEPVTTPAAPESAVPEKGADATSPPAAMPAGKIELSPDDRILGSDTAPVTVFEYASLTCGHCAQFSKEVLPEVKKALIDTGKLRLVFRDFPLDKVALKAAMMARCLPADKYFGMIEVIFSSQERWMSHEDPIKGLEQTGALAGMDSAAFEKCTTDEALEKRILAGMQEAQDKYQVKSTPSFVFNGGAETIAGSSSVEAFTETVNKLSGAKKQGE